MDLTRMIEGTFSRVNSTVFQPGQPGERLVAPADARGAAQPARPPRRPAPANLYDTDAPRDEAGGGRPREELPKYRTYDGSRQDPTDPEMGRVGSRFGRNAPAGGDRPGADARADGARARARSASRLLNRDTFKPATTLNVLAGCWIQFQNHDWFGHGENSPTSSSTCRSPEGDELARRHPMQVKRDEPRPHPDLNERACRRPTSTPSPTGGTARRSTAPTRSATASCAPARTAR